MKVLLDTHAFLWAVDASSHLSKKAIQVFESDQNELFLSAASVWEMAIKVSLGRLELPKTVNNFVAEQLAENRITFVEVGFRPVCQVATLPFHHRDPFDRLLAAQCLVDDYLLLSRDRVFKEYGVKTIW